MNFSVIPEGTDWQVVNHSYRRCYDYLLHRVAQILGDKNKAATWMHTKNPMLGDVTPVSMIAHGRGNRLERFVQAAEEANTGEDNGTANEGTT